MLPRHGSGGLKHVDTNNLWMQEAVHSEDIKVVKTARVMHAADSSASYSATNTLRHRMRLINCELVDHQERGHVGLSFAAERDGDSFRHHVISG